MKYLYATGKKGFRKAYCEYLTSGQEFDHEHRFTDHDLKLINNLNVGETAKLFDPYFQSDEIRITLVEG